MYSLNKDKTLRGDPFQINKYLKVKQPTLNEIIDLDNKYQAYCTYFIANTEDFIVKLHDLGLKYYELTGYDIFLKQFESEAFIKANRDKCEVSDDYIFLDESLNWWFDDMYNFKLVERNKIPILYDENKDIVFDMYAFEKMSYFIKLINCQPLTNKYKKPRDSVYRNLVQKRRARMERMSKKKNKQNNFLHDCILSVSCASNTFNLKNIWDLTIYQFYANLRKIQQIKEIESLNIGIYTGNIDTKKNKIDTDWIKDSIYKDEFIGFV